MYRLKLYFGLILLLVLKVFICIGTLFFLILFAPILLFIRGKSFHYCIDKFYENL